MDQTIIENGNNVETYVYRNRISSAVKGFETQMSRKFATEGKIIGKGNFEFCKVDGKLVQVIPQELHKPLKRVIKNLERDGLIASATDYVEEAAIESVLVAEEAMM